LRFVYHVSNPFHVSKQITN